MPIGISTLVLRKIVWVSTNVPECIPVFNAIYSQLKVYVCEHYITDSQHKQQIQQFNDKIYELAQNSKEAWISAMEHYEQYVRGELYKEALRVALDVAHEAKTALAKATEQKADYERGYLTFRKLLSASDKWIPLNEIVACIETRQTHE